MLGSPVTIAATAPGEHVLDPDLLVTLRAYVENLETSASALRADEDAESQHARFAEAFQSCANDLGRILRGELTAEHLRV